MSKQVVLTGIKPTGMPHMGNYLGAIRPAIDMARDENVEARFFIADYHSLNSVRDAGTLRSYIYEVAAVWLAAGLDPQKTLIYKQSDVPETFELTTILMAFTAKGLMNRAHAYKAAVDANREKGQSEDHQINMGLYTYPVLMAADILLFDTNVVPVGKDQVQHVEMAQDIAGVINHNYKEDLLVIPKAQTSENLMTIPGLDGRKMSKSYDNHIPMFLPEKQLRKIIMKIVTNSQGLEEPKDPDTCNVFALYKLFSTPEEQADLAARYRAGGMGWGHAKQELFEKLNAEIAPMRAVYDELMADTTKIDAILADGARRAREVASRTITRMRKAVGVA
ncbi:MAG: tryptophan--tRNA ligase [Spirochaetaceae bacterium]|nr:tryptophan--tRNA ligase [Spirochaetaceae bacterium]